MECKQESFKHSLFTRMRFIAFTKKKTAATSIILLKHAYYVTQIYYAVRKVVDTDRCSGRRFTFAIAFLIAKTRKRWSLPSQCLLNLDLCSAIMSCYAMSTSSDEWSEFVTLSRQWSVKVDQGMLPRIWRIYRSRHCLKRCQVRFLESNLFEKIHSLLIIESFLRNHVDVLLKLYFHLSITILHQTHSVSKQFLSNLTY